MNKLWMLQPKLNLGFTDYDPWNPWYDKNFGVIVRAADEQEARGIAAKSCAYEGEEAWLSCEHSDCVELPSDGPSGLIMVDHRAA